MISDVFQLVSERLIIRPYRLEDREHYVAKILESQAGSMPPQVLRPIAQQRFLSKVGNPVRAGQPFTLAAFDLNNPDAFVLDATFSSTMRDPESIELGYHVLMRYRGQGLMTEALKTILPPLVTRLPGVRVQASVAGLNTRSIRVLQKTGFEPKAAPRSRGQWEYRAG